MPKVNEGRGFYVTATKATVHNAPVTENGLVGVAVKQTTPAWDAALAVQKNIAIGERFFIDGDDEHEVPKITGATLGQGVYIRATDNSLHLAGATAAGDIPYGLVTGLPGDAQGCPTDSMRVNLDQRGVLALV